MKVLKIENILFTDERSPLVTIGRLPLRVGGQLNAVLSSTVSKLSLEISFHAPIGADKAQEILPNDVIGSNPYVLFCSNENHYKMIFIFENR
jgi:hypothetical protein